MEMLFVIAVANEFFSLLFCLPSKQFVCNVCNSKRRFAEQQAEEWWKENQERVFKKYSHRMPSTSSASSTSASKYVKEDG